MAENEYLALILHTCACWIKNSHNGKYKQVVQIFNFGSDTSRIGKTLNQTLDNLFVLDENHRLYSEHQFLLRRSPVRPNLRRSTSEGDNENVIRKAIPDLNLDTLVRSIRLASIPVSDLTIRKFCERARRDSGANLVFVVYLSESGVKTLSELVANYVLPLDDFLEQVEPAETREYDVPHEPRPLSGLRDSCDQIKTILTETLISTKRRSRESEKRNSNSSNTSSLNDCR